jgi:uncharacterized protein (DUF1015 family)
MPHTIKAFRATYYNPSIFKNLSRVTCPPYDVINKRQEFSLRRKSPYNFCNVLLSEGGNYKKLGRRFRQWFNQKILIKDNKESLYLYEQKFKIEGKKYLRFGALALLKMNGKKAIYPHEHTLKAPKEDRKKIIREVQANLSPIFVIASGRLKVLRRLHQSYRRKKPFAVFKDSDGNANRVWKIEDKITIQQLCREFDKHKLTIADGHHRFEVSYGYYLKNKARFKDLGHILAYVTDAQKGLVILPTHRIVSFKENLSLLDNKIGQYFKKEEVKEQELKRKLKNTKEFCFGLYCNGKFYFIKLKNKLILDRIFKGSIYKNLDTYILHQLVLPLFNIGGNIQYTHDIAEARKLAIKDKAAFILRPTELEAVFKIANQGYRLPQKSTYFYPKVLSGIVVRTFDKRE